MRLWKGTHQLFYINVGKRPFWGWGWGWNWIPSYVCALSIQDEHSWLPTINIGPCIDNKSEGSHTCMVMYIKNQDEHYLFEPNSMHESWTLYDGVLNCFSSKVLHNVERQTHWEWPSLTELRNSSFKHLSRTHASTSMWGWEAYVCVCVFVGGGGEGPGQLHIICHVHSLYCCQYICHTRGSLWPDSKSHPIVK